MAVKKIMTSERVYTTVSVQRAGRIAEECGVSLVLVEAEVKSGNKYMNDFEVAGPVGNVEKFLVRLKDVEVL